MTPPEQENRGFWTGFAVLLLVGILLGIRAETATRAVLSFQGKASARPGSAAPPANASTAIVAHRDSLIAAATMPDRDPFHGIAAPRPARAAAPPDTVTPQVTPVLRAMFYDAANPTVKIGIGTASSGWLHRGDTFGGWSVMEIKPRSVWISKNGSNVYLSSQ